MYANRRSSTGNTFDGPSPSRASSFATRSTVGEFSPPIPLARALRPESAFKIWAASSRVCRYRRNVRIPNRLGWEEGGGMDGQRGLIGRI